MTTVQIPSRQFSSETSATVAAIVAEPVYFTGSTPTGVRRAPAGSTATLDAGSLTPDRPGSYTIDTSTGPVEIIAFPAGVFDCTICRGTRDDASKLRIITGVMNKVRGQVLDALEGPTVPPMFGLYGVDPREHGAPDNWHSAPSHGVQS